MRRSAWTRRRRLKVRVSAPSSEVGGSRTLFSVEQASDCLFHLLPIPSDLDEMTLLLSLA